MVMYPYPQQIKEAIENSKKNNWNFGLWFNKYIPVGTPGSESEFKAVDRNGDDKKVNSYYIDQYQNLIDYRNILQLLEKQHQHMDSIGRWIANNAQNSYIYLKIRAELKSPLLIGLGIQHPSENGFIFHHNLGIPYIPASSMKGLLRFAYQLQLLDSYPDQLEEWSKIESDKGEAVLDEEHPGTGIPLLFGGKEKIKGKSSNSLRGKIIFMDGYPETVPDMKLDITTVHFRSYYSSEGKEPPRENENPLPVQFMAISEGTPFIFRFIIPADTQFKEVFINAVRRALENEGVGAKTSLGYGLFNLIEIEENDRGRDGSDTIGVSKEKKAQRLDISQVKEEILKNIDKHKEDYTLLVEQFRIWQGIESLKSDEEIAKKFLPLINKTTKKGKITEEYKRLAAILNLELEERDTGEKKSDDPLEKLKKRAEQIITYNKPIKKKELKKFKALKDYAPELYEKLVKQVK